MRAVAIAGGIVAAVAIVAVIVLGVPWGNTSSGLELSGTGSACTIVTAAADKNVSVKKNKKVTWHVKNSCDTAQTVSVGNFRTVQTGSATNCTNSTEGGATWPFKSQDENNRSVTVDKGKTDDIVLKEAKNAGGTQLTYYFDVCLGGVKKDPRLIIEP